MHAHAQVAGAPRGTQLHPPSIDQPYWHEPGGARHSFISITIGQDAAALKRLAELHAQSIKDLVLAATEPDQPRSTRALTNAAARLCQELSGLWPVDAVSNH